MYREERWDAKSRSLCIRTTPDGQWRPATLQQTIEYLADRVATLERAAAEDKK